MKVLERSEVFFFYSVTLDTWGSCFGRFGFVLRTFEEYLQSMGKRGNAGCTWSPFKDFRSPTSQLRIELIGFGLCLLMTIFAR